MAQWRIKEMSDMTNVSVRMLHHYDKIGLLTPSVRASNGYRWYSEQDLATLQQIIALKCFGFNLGQIKTMVRQKPQVLEHLRMQEQILKEQVEHLQQTQQALGTVLARCADQNALGSNDLLTLIERYRMVEQLKNTLIGKMSEKQQDRYFAFRQAYPKEVVAWEKMIAAINEGKVGDPEGADGERAARTFLRFSKAKIAWEASLQILQKATNEDLQEAATFGKMAGELAAKGGGLFSSQEGNKWFMQARIAYRLRCFDDLYNDIKKHCEADPESVIGKKLAARWCELIAEDCMGGSIELFFGMKLLGEAVQTKIALQGQDCTPEKRLSIVQNGLKMLSDPMVIAWIEKALKTK